MDDLLARPYPELPRSGSVVIIGAGIMGSSIALHLARKGLRDVVVLERDTAVQGRPARTPGHPAPVLDRDQRSLLAALSAGDRGVELLSDEDRPPVPADRNVNAQSR